MNNQARLQALSAFLKLQRAKISPEAAGLPSGTRRRTPGLRREEVAQLAGVSTTWYTWLEQGRDIQVSASVLDCVAAALKLTADERKYLFSLAMEQGKSSPASYAPELAKVSPSLQKIMQELRFCPVIMTDHRCYIVGWNNAASHIFIRFDRLPPEERNLIRLLFTRPELRRLAVNWEQFVSDYLAMFRSYYGEYMEDGWYEPFLEEMRTQHPDFSRLWEQTKVSTAPDMQLEFRHAKAGKMMFELTSLKIQGASDLRMSIYTPSLHTNTEAKLKKLMEAQEPEGTA